MSATILFIVRSQAVAATEASKRFKSERSFLSGRGGGRNLPETQEKVDECSGEFFLTTFITRVFFFLNCDFLFYSLPPQAEQQRLICFGLHIPYYLEGSTMNTFKTAGSHEIRIDPLVIGQLL